MKRRSFLAGIAALPVAASLPVVAPAAGYAVYGIAASPAVGEAGHSASFRMAICTEDRSVRFCMSTDAFSFR